MDPAPSERWPATPELREPTDPPETWWQGLRDSPAALREAETKRVAVDEEHAAHRLLAC